MTSFNLNYLLKSPVSKYGHTGDQGFNLSLEAHNSVHNRGITIILKVHPGFAQEANRRTLN